MLRYGIAALAIASLAGCVAPSQPGPSGSVMQTIQVDAGREFEIAVGQEARVRGTPIILRFRGVTQDSRCPSDVQCVWAGNAVARITLGGSGTSSTDVALNTTLDPKFVVFSGYRITFVGLKPVPKSGATIPSAEYVATVVVSPA